MSWKGRSLKAGDRVRVGRRALSVPGVPSMTDRDRPTEASVPARAPDRQPAIDRDAKRATQQFLALYGANNQPASDGQ